MRITGRRARCAGWSGLVSVALPFWCATATEHTAGGGREQLPTSAHQPCNHQQLHQLNLHVHYLSALLMYYAAGGERANGVACPLRESAAVLPLLD